jgi:outer membrane protein assembly factor BamA
MAMYPDSSGTKQMHRLKITGYPAAGYSPETSVQLGAVGVILINPDQAESPKIKRPAIITPYFLYTFKNQFMSAVNTEFYRKNKNFFNFIIRYFDYPDLYFGNNSNPVKVAEKFTNEFFKMDATTAWIFHENLFAGLNLEYGINHLYAFEKGGVLEQGHVTGTRGGQTFGIGPYIRYDSRDNIFYPLKGWFVETSVLFFEVPAFNDYAFSNFELDVRHFTTVFSKKNVLAFQVSFNLAWGDEVPFYQLPQLGGDSRLRGIDHENRYRDKNSFYVQAEARRELFWRFGGVLFAGFGNVNSSLTDLQFKEMKYVIGAGGRLRPFKNERLNLRMDIGKGPGDQYAVYLAVREAF